MSTPSQQPSEEASSVAPGGQQYPPQIHAGAVGYGPNYHSGPGIGEKFDGIKEELKGKVMHKPELVEHGRELRTGVAKEKELNDDAGNPFKEPEEKKSDAPTTAAPNTQPPSANNPRSTGGNVHGSDSGAAQQAASVAPEGTKEAETQARGEQGAGDKVIDAST